MQWISPPRTTIGGCPQRTSCRQMAQDMDVSQRTTTATYACPRNTGSISIRNCVLLTGDIIQGTGHLSPLFFLRHKLGGRQRGASEVTRRSFKFRMCCRAQVGIVENWCCQGPRGSRERVRYVCAGSIWLRLKVGGTFVQTANWRLDSCASCSNGLGSRTWPTLPKKQNTKANAIKTNPN